MVSTTLLPYRQAGLARVSLYFIVLAFLALFNSISATQPPGNSCSFSWNNAFYVLGANSPISSFTNFSVLETPFKANKLSWSATPSFTAVSLSALFPCVLASSGLLILAPLSNSSFVAYDLKSSTFNANLQTSNAPNKDLFSLEAGANSSRIVVPVNDSIYVFGTITDADSFWILDLNTNVWTEDRYASGSQKAPMVNGAGLAVVNGKVVVVGGKQDRATDKVWTYDLVGKVWALEGEVLPSPRANTAVVPFGASTIFVFGGMDDSDMPIDDILSLDFSTSPPSFTSLDNASPKRPSPVFNPSVATLGDALIVYGGFNNTVKTDSIYIFNFDSANWVDGLCPAGIDCFSTLPLKVGLGGGLGFFALLTVIVLLWNVFRRRRNRIRDIDYPKPLYQPRTSRPQSQTQFNFQFQSPSQPQSKPQSKPQSIFRFQSRPQSIFQFHSRPQSRPQSQSQFQSQPQSKSQSRRQSRRQSQNQFFHRISIDSHNQNRDFQSRYSDSQSAYSDSQSAYSDSQSAYSDSQPAYSDNFPLLSAIGLPRRASHPPVISNDIPEAHLALHTKVSWVAPENIVPWSPRVRKSLDMDTGLELPAAMKRFSGGAGTSEVNRFSTASALFRRIRERNENADDKEEDEDEEDDEYEYESEEDEEDEEDEE